MIALATCPCCSEPLLHCIRRGESYWFCPTCWLDFPKRIQAPPPTPAARQLDPQPAPSVVDASLAAAA